MIETPQQAAHQLARKLLLKGFEFEALHEYQAATGQPLYWRIRLTHRERQAKWIRPMVCEGGRYRLGEPAFSGLGKPLYRLPQLVEAKDEVIWIVEGEQCADTLARFGLVVTTSGGAESAQGADWSVLAHRKVRIWPDFDEAGQGYAQGVTRRLLAYDCHVTWVAVDALGLPAKGDCVDWLLANPEACRAALEALPVSQPVQKPGVLTQPVLCELPRLTLSELGLFTEPVFIYHSSGVYYWGSKDQLVKICSPLKVEALVRDELSEHWGRLLSFEDADGALHRWAMPMELLKGSGEELRGELLRQGLEIGSGGRIRSLLTEYITQAKPTARARCVERVGWYGQVFVFPEQTIGESAEQVIYQAPKLVVKAYQSQGTLGEWQREIAKRSEGNSRLVLALSCAFAGMLLGPSGMESGGLHLVGESSTGKTTALRIAASVYGGPSYVNRWRATTNGLEALAVLRSDMLLILDELAQVDPREAGEAAYLLANGGGKARAGRSGGARACQSWRLLFLSAGEVGLMAHVQAAGKQTQVGQGLRLVEIPADAGAGMGMFERLHDQPHAGALSQTLVEATNQSYGTAAKAFLEAITVPSDVKDLGLKIRDYQQAFLAQTLPWGASGQVRRVYERFSLIAAAGELASHYGITGWPKGEATQASAQCAKAWLEQRGHVGHQEHQAILGHVQAFFEAHGASRFEDLQDNQAPRIINRVGFKRRNVQGEYEYLVLPEMFRRELCQSFPQTLVTQVLKEGGMLKLSGEGRPLTPQRLGAEGVRKCYHFIRTTPLEIQAD